MGVVAITYMFGTGGPIGSESIVAEGGPVVALLGLLLYPVFFSTPYACVLTELTAAFPEDGGFTIWAMNAFGPFWSIQVGYWSWLAGVMSLAIFPQLLLDTCARFTTVEIHGEYCIKAAIGVILALPSLLGTKLISRSSTLLTALVLVIVVTFSVWGLAKPYKDNLHLLLHARSKNDDDSDSLDSIPWFDVLNKLYWNYEGIRMASVFGGQVRNPAGVYARAVWIVVALSVVTYTLPLIGTMVSGSRPWQLFDLGAYELAAEHVGGHGLRAVVIASTFASCIGLYNAGVFCCSTEISGMAENRLLPAVLATRNQQFLSPHYSILVSLAVAVGLMAVDSNKLLVVANTFSGLVTITIFLSAIQIRRSMPYIPRPMRVPGGLLTLCAVSVLPVTLCSCIIVRTLTTSAIGVRLVVGFSLPPLIYAAIRTYRKKTLLYR
ncbi:hypothetical protein P43SY_002895 [Pythium insidiosum]|uniref:Uncharacterized protein n=1 Tax=Pythium insidiosum TaxID=114742 RepID=A0AAD5Q6N9_PYTIN|nr:hypothetical protein P43SY_002895 [Pythium insidiosum]